MRSRVSRLWLIPSTCERSSIVLSVTPVKPWRDNIVKLVTRLKMLSKALSVNLTHQDLKLRLFLQG
jgi:hypothetical protein